MSRTKRTISFRGEPEGFRSALLEGISDGRWELPGGVILLPRVFGFCNGVQRALKMLEQAVRGQAQQTGRFFLLGQIIHNPWVNDYFTRQGVQILEAEQRDRLEDFIGPADCAVIPAFGVPVAIEQRLKAIGCRIVDTTCGNVRRLWTWAAVAAAEGFGLLIYGRPRHDETMVIKSRLADVGGRYLVVSGIARAEEFCSMVAGDLPADSFRRRFDNQETNADSLEPLLRLAQVSQTTMLYSETMRVRELLRQAFARRFGEQADAQLRFEPTVCGATRDRQNAAVELCQAGCDLAVVVGGYGSSNTRHLFEVALSYAPAYFIEDARAIRSAEEIDSVDPDTDQPAVIRNWLPAKRPLRIAVLAGASSPEVVIGQVLQRLAEFLR